MNKSFKPSSGKTVTQNIDFDYYNRSHVTKLTDAVHEGNSRNLSTHSIQISMQKDHNIVVHIQDVLETRIAVNATAENERLRQQTEGNRTR